MDSFLSVCLRQQLRLVNTVAQCVDNVTTEYRFCSPGRFQDLMNLNFMIFLFTC